MTKLPIILCLALLLTGCSGNTDSSSSQSEQTQQAASDTDKNTDHASITDFEYTDVRTDPFKAYEKKQNGETGFTDYEAFSSSKDIAASIWGEFYKQQYGIPTDKLLPSPPEGSTDCGGGASLDNFTLGFNYTPAGAADTMLFSVKTYLYKKYSDTSELLADISNEDTGDLVRDNIYQDGDFVIEHYSESIYYQYRLTAINSQGLRYEVTSAQPSVTIDDLKAFDSAMTY